MNLGLETERLLLADYFLQAFGKIHPRLDLLDLIKSYAKLLILPELDGGGNVRRDVEDVIPETTKKITSAQFEEAAIFAKHWKK